MPAKRKTLKPSKTNKKVRAPRPKPPGFMAVPEISVPAHLNRDKFYYLLTAWAIVMIGFFSLPNYRQLLPEGYPFGNVPTRWFLLAGLGAMAVLWRMVPVTREDSLDFSPLTARVWFWVLLGLGAAMRLYRPEEPANFFWDDHYVVVSDIRSIVDFHNHPLLFPFGWREPLYPYFSALLWEFLPHSTGVFVIRLSSTLIDLTTLWIFYLIGKEIGGRRMGILLMAMGAISKEMIMICKFGYGSGTTVLGCALTFLFFLRVLKKPDWIHFLEWGTALGFGAYSYVPFRVWTPVILGCMWLWVFSDSRERVWNFFRVILGPGLMAAWAFLFFYKNMFLPEKNGTVIFLTSPLALTLVAALLAVSYGRVFLENREKGPTKLLGWATGALATALVMTPLYLHPHYSEHVADIFTAFAGSAKNPGAGGGPLGYLWGHFIMGHYFMFGKFDDVGRLPAAGDSWFDYYAAVCGLLGLAYFAARPTWLKAFVLLLYLVGMVPYIFTFNPHPFRLEAIVLPVLLTGAWGLNRLWLAYLQTGPTKGGNMACAAFLLFFCGWEVDRNSKLLAEWMAQKGPDSVAAAAVEEQWPAHRVYLRPFRPVFYTASQDILCDNKDIYRMNDSNIIEIAPGEKGKDLVVMVSGKDLDIQKKMETAFPGLPWFKRYIYWEDQIGVPFLKGMIVPFDRLEKNDNGLFTLQFASPTLWHRCFYGRYGMGRGLILHNDLANHWNDSLPVTKPEPYEWDHATASVEGVWNVASEGEYVLSLSSGNALWLFIDGKKVINLFPGDNFNDKTRKVFLKAGPHQVKMLNCFSSELRFTTVYISRPGQASKEPLDDLVSRTAPR